MTNEQHFADDGDIKQLSLDETRSAAKQLLDSVEGDLTGDVAQRFQALTRSDTRNTVDHIIFQGERSPSLTHKRTKRQPAIAAGLNAPRRNRVGRQHGWPADVPSAEQRRAQRQRDLEAIRRAYAEMVATSHEIDDDTAELALLSMHLDDEQRRLEAGMKLGWHPYHFPDEPDSKQ